MDLIARARGKDLPFVPLDDLLKRSAVVRQVVRVRREHDDVVHLNEKLALADAGIAYFETFLFQKPYGFPLHITMRVPNADWSARVISGGQGLVGAPGHPKTGSSSGAAG